MQYSSGVMNVTDSFFERGITFFTNLVYTQIRYSVANGDVAPFVGHNAILRWAAVQEIAYDLPARRAREVLERGDHRVRRLRHGAAPADGRLHRAPGGVRQRRLPGRRVSLIVYDELMRWEKYAYGCSELIFHPVLQWGRRGPLTPLFKSFVRSRMPLPSKITILAYIGTYYALGSSWILTLLNYVVVGWFNGYCDGYYVDSFKIIVGIVAVFTLLGNVALAVLRYRIGEAALVPALLDNFRWIPLLFVFLGGVSLHVSQALVSHMAGREMVWGATSKEGRGRELLRGDPARRAAVPLHVRAVLRARGRHGGAGDVGAAAVAHRVHDGHLPAEPGRGLPLLAAHCLESELDAVHMVV